MGGACVLGCCWHHYPCACKRSRMPKRPNIVCVFHAAEALEQLCADNDYSCWCTVLDDDDRGSEGGCPLMSADGYLQVQPLQGCEQKLRYVCRKENS